MQQPQPPLPRPGRTILYSDLDGTFLDHHTYSWREAAPALAAALARSVPLVFCSSKTQAEIRHIREAASVGDPFIAENGAAVFIPAGYFSSAVPGAVRRGSFEVIELGTPYAMLVEVLRRVREGLSCRVVGFSDLSEAELAADCGLSMEEARRAKQRGYDEAFKVLEAGPADLERLLGRIREAGFRWTVGGRYFHLFGNNDKGQAVSRLTEIFRGEAGSVCTVGLGDSLNDLPLLEAVDYPVLVRKPNGRYDPQVLEALSSVKLARGVGPTGWNAAVLEILGATAGADGAGHGPT